MKLKNSLIIASQEVIGKVANTPLPVKQAYKIKKTLNSLKQQVEFINDQRNELIKKYGIENGDTYEIPKDDKEAMQNFFSEYNALLGMEEDVDVRTLDLDDLEGLELTCNDLEVIDFMITNQE